MNFESDRLDLFSIGGAPPNSSRSVERVGAPAARAREGRRAAAGADGQPAARRVYNLHGRAPDLSAGTTSTTSTTIVLTGIALTTGIEAGVGIGAIRRL